MGRIATTPRLRALLASFQVRSWSTAMTQSASVLGVVWSSIQVLFDMFGPVGRSVQIERSSSAKERASLRFRAQIVLNCYSHAGVWFQIKRLIRSQDHTVKDCF